MWATDRWQQLNRRLGAEPLALTDRRLVYAANEAALGLGVYVGMPVAQAQAMLPGLRVETADPAGDVAALRRLAGWCLRFSPLAAPCVPDSVWIDVSGCAHLHGDEDRLVQAIMERLGEAGLAARVAVADTPGCAYALARYGLDALCVVPPGEGPAALLAALAPLPIEALRLDAAVSAGLRNLGFDTIAQLTAAPRAPLARRFGAGLMRRLDQALGRAGEPLEPVAPAGLIRVRQGFPEPIATSDDLLRITALLTERLCDKLRQADLGASRLDLVFVRVDGLPQMVQVGTAAATRDAAHLTRLLSAQIETVDPGFGVDSVWLAAPLTGNLGARQVVSDLAAGHAAADLSSLIDTLLNRLGSRNVFRVASVESDIPERSVRRVAPGGSETGGRWPASLPRPSRLLNPPRAVDAVSLLPDHAPVQFTLGKRAHRVRASDGPERIFGEWWRADDEFFAVRDYFQVEDEDGRRFWLFREGDGEHPESGDMGWYLHGLFG